MKKPKLSVIMAVHSNKTDYRTMLSVLNQSFKDFEFIIIDDASPKFFIGRGDKRIKLIFNGKNIGLTKSLIKGINIAKGKYIARIDYGDTCMPTRFEKQVKFLDTNKDYALVGSNVTMINKEGEPIGYIKYLKTNRQIQKSLMKTNMFAHSTLMIRKSVLNDVGQYNPDYKYSQDYDLILRISEKFKVANLNEKLISLLYDKKGTTVSSKRADQEYYAYLARCDSAERKGEYIYPYTYKYYISTIIPMFFKIFMLNFLIGFNKMIGREFKVNIHGKKIVFNEGLK